MPIWFCCLGLGLHGRDRLDRDPGLALVVYLSGATALILEKDDKKASSIIYVFIFICS